MSIVTHPLPGGGHAELRDPSEITERLRRPIRTIQLKLAKDSAFASVVQEAAAKGADAARNLGESEAALMMASMGEDALAMMDELNDRLILARVVRWSYDAEVSAEGLLDLPGAAYDRLKELCAEGALAGVDFEPSTDEDSPTAPSTACAQR